MQMHDEQPKRVIEIDRDCALVSIATAVGDIFFAGDSAYILG